MKVDRAVTLPFTCEQIFDLAADIERYPEFLPGWISARILSRAVDQLEVEQVLGIGPARVQFRSRAVLHRPKQIAVTFIRTSLSALRSDVAACAGADRLLPPEGRR